MTKSYDDQNVFAKILRGEIPSHRVYEDEDQAVRTGNAEELRKALAGEAAS